MATLPTPTTIAEPLSRGVSTAIEQTFGPGEAGYLTQLKAYDKAFGQFFARLAKDGITKDDTLFVITADENDHFAGGPPSPANCDWVNTPCTYAVLGEIDANLDSVIATEFGDTTPFNIHFDDAPTFYINGNPGQTDPVTRNLERESGKLLGFDVYDGPNGGTNRIAKALADYAEQDLLHMITADPNRTPNFILFANPDYVFLTSGKTPPPACTPTQNAMSCFAPDTGFAWNHGDFQNQITKTWLGVVGPGVLELGRFGESLPTTPISGQQSFGWPDSRTTTRMTAACCLRPSPTKQFRPRCEIIGTPSRLWLRLISRSTHHAARSAPAP